MARKVFYSFHYKPDCWRTAQVRNMGIVEGNQPVSDNDWESIKASGDAAVESWIKGQLKGRSCTVVLIGAKTSTRKWVKHEIKETWSEGKGLVGIYVHNLKDSDGLKSSKGDNPFDLFTVGGKKLSSIVKAYDPPYTKSTNVYDYISKNISDWIEEAITIRNNY
jgi:hypothetical protein